LSALPCEDLDARVVAGRRDGRKMPLGFIEQRPDGAAELAAANWLLRIC
jgi:hypothetical protein